MKKLIPNTSSLVKKTWLLDNGSKEVELYDPSEKGWEAFCKECKESNSKLLRNIAQKKESLIAKGELSPHDPYITNAFK